MIVKELKREIERLEELKKQIQYKQGNAKAGEVHEKLTCKRKKQYFQYYIDEKYVSKKKALKRLRQLAKEEYWDRLLPVLEIELGHLRNALTGQTRLEKAYNQMHEGKQVLFEPDIVPISKKIQDFNNVTYKGLPFSESDKSDYHTYRGERVRSKSEKIIADELERQGIPYHYEMPLLLRVDGQMKEFHPDFTVMNITTGEVKYMEHFGMMDNPSYYNNVLSKLDVYERNGLLIGRDIILLHESSLRPLSTRIIADYIQEFLV